MPRDLLDTNLSILCTEAERMSVALRVVVEAQPALLGLGLDPVAAEAKLLALAARARELAGTQGTHQIRLAAAQEEAREVAQAYYAAQTPTRRRLRAMMTLGAGPLVLTAQVHARAYRLTRPRLQGALDQARRVVDELEGRASLLRSTPSGEALYADALAWRTRLEELYTLREDAAYAHAMATAPVQEARAQLLTVAQRVRIAWESARVISGNAFPALILDLAEANAARLRKARAARAAAKVAQPTHTERHTETEDLVGFESESESGLVSAGCGLLVRQESTSGR